MKAQVFYEKEIMRLEERPIPTPGPDEVLVQVKNVGVCGSDVTYFFGGSPLGTPDGKGPLVLGHEFTGVIAGIGAIPKEKGLFKEGDRVVINPVQQCNACETCFQGYVNLCPNGSTPGVDKDGGFQEFMVSKYWGAVKLPENVSFQQGAFTEPLACSTYGVQNMQVKPGNFAVVMGPGAIGLMMTQLIKASGAGTVVLVGAKDGNRLELGKELGADVLIDVADKASPYYCEDLKAKILELNNGKLADRVITPTHAIPAMELALEISGNRAVVVYFGLPGPDDYVRVPAMRSIFADKTIRFSWCAPHVWPTALTAVAKGLVNVKPLLTGSYPLEETERVMRDLRDRVGNPLKCQIVL
jgi:threonine dehydrogenase-like Zn-dependent dehydrogenase